jgi:transposase-like protein
MSAIGRCSARPTRFSTNWPNRASTSTSPIWGSGWARGSRKRSARRYGCRRCGRTFRVYPLGVNQDQTSKRLKGLAVLLYLLGLSYGAVALVLEALGHPLGKTAVYQAVQTAGERVPGLRHQAVQVKPWQALGVDLTRVKCGGAWLTVGVSVEAISGTALTVDILDDEEAETLKTWVKEIDQVVGAAVLVSDDANGFKEAADDNGLPHQVCKAHVQCYTEAWVKEIRPRLQQDEDGSLAAIGVAAAQAVADVEALLRLVQERPPGREGEEELARTTIAT